MRYSIRYRKFNNGIYVGEIATEKKFQTIDRAQEHLCRNGFMPSGCLRYERVWEKENCNAYIED